MWVSDGTVAGTQPLSGLPLDGGADYPYAFTRMGDRVYFFAGLPAHLYATDGTTTSLLFDFPANEYMNSGPPWPVAVLGDKLYFATTLHTYVLEGTSVRAVFDDTVASPQQLFATSSRLIFPTPNGIYSYDGSDAGPQALAGAPPNYFDFVPLAASGELLYFRHREWDAYGVLTDSLWATDGTDAGTRFVAPVQFDDVSYSPSPPLIALPLEPEGRIVFPAHSRLAGTELWVSDGTGAGTRPVVEIARGPLPSRPGRPTRFGNKLLVPAETHTGGRELWSIDMAAVTDNVPPELTCPSDMSTSTTDPTGKTVSFTPVAHDAVSGVSIVSQPASGSKFPIGTTQVTVRATDAFGNAGTCTFSVTMALVGPDAGSNPPPPQTSGGKSGCSVASGGSSLGTGVLAVLALLALTGRRKRTRH
jgi:MYXO-CTERM domain-containing protein